MPGKNARVTALGSRKQMLIAESELNRAALLRDWQAMADDVHALARTAGTISSWVSIAASLAAGVAFFRRKKSAPTAEKPSWLQSILKGSGLISILWQAFRSKGRRPDGS
jgi:hypothetical protein